MQKSNLVTPPRVNSSRAYSAAVAVLLLLTGTADIIFAAVYYVSPTSVSTDWVAAQNISAPCSAATAMLNAVAGDTVYFRGGTYQLGPSAVPGQADIGYHATLEPANSGTSDNPITFQAYPGEEAVLNGHVTVNVTGIADAGTDNYHLVDNDVDFIAAGVVGWRIFRTTDKEGGAAVDTVETHTVTFQTGTHNSNVNLLPGDAYTIGQDIVSPIGVWRQEYIIIDGFKVQADDGLNAARIIIGSHSADYYARGLVVRNCEVYGGTTKIVHGDNREGIRVECTEGALVSGCKVNNFLNVTNNQNTSAFKTYDNNNFIFKNNERYDPIRGFFIKRRTNGAVIKNNYVHDCCESIMVTSFISPEYNSQRNISIFNNVVTYSESFTMSDFVQETSDSDNMRVYNNTFYTGYGTAATVTFGAGAKYYYNNILVGRPRDYDLGHLRFSSRDPAGGGVPVKIMECDHNLFDPLDSSQGLLIRTIKYGDSAEYISTNYQSLPAWQSSGELDDGSNPGTGSLAASPLFLNASGAMNQLDDFRLAAGSPARNAGRDGVNMGADIDMVGIEGTGSDDPEQINTGAPNAPAGLTIK